MGISSNISVNSKNRLCKHQCKILSKLVKCDTSVAKKFFDICPLTVPRIVRMAVA